SRGGDGHRRRAGQAGCGDTAAREDDPHAAEEGSRGRQGREALGHRAQARRGKAVMAATPTPTRQRLTLVRPEPSSSVLRAEGLMKRYRKRTVVSDVSLTAETGEVVGLL